MTGQKRGSHKSLFEYITMLLTSSAWLHKLICSVVDTQQHRSDLSIHTLGASKKCFMKYLDNYIINSSTCLGAFKVPCPVVWDSIHLMMGHIVKLSGVTTSMHHSSSSPGFGLRQGPNHSLKPCFLRQRQKPGCPNSCQFSGTKAKSYENETHPDKKL